MSCSSRVKKSLGQKGGQQGRRLSGSHNVNETSKNNKHQQSSRRSLLGESLAMNPAAWFHNSLQHLSHGWNKFNKLGIIIGRHDKRAEKCSTWFVDQTDNNNRHHQALAFFSRRTISEESIDFFDRFSKISERANTVRRRGGRNQHQVARHIHGVDHQKEPSSPQLSDGSDECGDRVEAPQPAPRSRPKFRGSTPTGWVWGPELIAGPEAENVYCEVLYSLLHAIRSGSDSGSIDEVFHYLRNSFQYNEAKHEELLASVGQRTPPDVSLQLGVLQARNLKGKDVNGLSDPYCSIWISSNRQKWQDTTMKPKTLDPVWNETLTFSVKDANEDVLQLEVWDFDPDETVKEKMSRITEVKDFRGMGILLKQIAVASKAPGKPAHKFLGLLNVALKTVPLSGLERWYPLEGKDKTKPKERGEIRLNLALSASRTEAQFTLQESFVQYERLLRIVVEHELRSDVEWRGIIPESAAVMLRQFAAHRGLRQAVTDACSWSVYATALHKRTLDFLMVLGLVQRLRKAINDGKMPEDELVNVFWTGADSFVGAALSTIRHLRNNCELTHKPEQLSALLECLKELHGMGPTRFADLETRISDAVTMGAADWFSRVAGGRRQGGPICDDDRLENIIRIVQSLMADLKTTLTVFQPAFRRAWNLAVFDIVYVYYDNHLSDLSKPVVDGVTRTLKSIHTPGTNIKMLALEASGEMVNRTPKEQEEHDAMAPRLSMGTSLFELYLLLQQFQKLAGTLPETEKEKTKLPLFYTWFETAVDRWLDIALYKAMIRIGKAVSLDNLQTVDSMVKYSSSAVDTVTVFYQIKTFWDQLAWPDVKGALAFVIKIVDDVRQSSCIYAEAVGLKLERINADSDGPFFISLKTCAAINSILHVQQALKPLSEELGLYKLLDVVQNGGSQTAGRQSQEFLTTSAIRDMDDKLDEIFIAIARKFEVEVGKLINKVMETDFGARQTDELNSYISDQLLTLDSHLEKDVFQRVLNVTYHHILQNFLNVIDGEIQKKRQPNCFRGWQELLCILDNCFADPDAEDEDEILAKIRWLLKLHGMETSDLIHQHRLERIKATESQDIGLGSMTVRAVFVDDALNINVLNARNLIAMDSDGTADPYFKVRLLPTHHFPDAAVLKSKVHKSTLYPLFDENFTYPVPKSLQSNEECCVLFTVKDKDLIGSDELMGEVFLSFQQIPRGDSGVEMQDLAQIILPLTKPSEKGSEYLNVLEGRTWDKTARDFAKKEKKQMNGK